MFGTREFRFSYTDKDGELQYLHTRNIYLAAKIVAERGGSDCKRAPLPKNKPLTTGTCQICGREIGSTTGLIAHHGYQRPGQGWQTASCFGAKWRPYEVACDAIPPAIRQCEDFIANQEAFVSEWLANPPATITKWSKATWKTEAKKFVYDRPSDFNGAAQDSDGVTHMPYTDDRYTQAYRAELSTARMQIRFGKSDLEVLKKRLADWKAPK